MQRMITILGPTACGKTTLAVALARRVGGEIISADSRQVYRRMDIGTGKDLSDYGLSLHSTVSPTVLPTVPYYLIDICEPGTKYNLFRYLNDFSCAYDTIVSHGAVPILCGGTGLYIEAVLKDFRLSPVPQNSELRRRLEGKSLEELTTMLRSMKARNGSHMHNTTDVDTPQRAIRAIEIEYASMKDEHVLLPSEQGPQLPTANYSGLVFGIDIERDKRRERISNRLKARLEDGLVDEVRGLLSEGIKAEDLIYYGLEYKYVTEYVIGKISYDEMYRLLEIAIHQFAKRQMTWFRGMERRGIAIQWIDAELPTEEKVEFIMSKTWQ